MKNFVRALRMASKYWLSVVLAAACSFAVAALWGANIGAFYPILEVTIRGKSTQQWLDEEITKHTAAIDLLEDSIAQQETLLQAAENDAQDVGQVAVGQMAGANNTLQDTINEQQSQLQIHRAQREGYLRMKPWVDRFVPGTPFATISLIVLALVISTLIKHFFLVTNELLVGKVALDISRDLRNQIFGRALHMDRVSFAARGNAGFVTLIIHTTEMLSNGLMNTMGAAIREPLKVIACLFGAAMICWRLLILSVLIAPLVGVLLYFLTRRIKSVSLRVLDKATGFHEVLLEALGNIQTVQSFRREASEQGRFEDATLLMKQFGLRFIFLASLSKPIIEFLGIGMLGTTIVGGAYLVLNQETHLLGIQICDQPLSVSALLVFFGMLIGISDPLRKMSAVYSSIYTASIAADSIFPLLDQQSTISDPAEAKAVARPHRCLKIDDLSFAYSPEQPVLNHISLDIPFGSTVAIIGSNGSGKSTLINLLCRFYDPKSGGLKLDGVDYREMQVKDVRSRFALVNQHTELFNETVAYNIRYGTPEATDEEVERVARQAHAHEFISTALADGYQTVVGQNGNRLSGGQRQRIALARALLCDPEILILDEATSQIDMQSEQLIRESLEEHLGQRTLIIITHREKLLELADRVFEMKYGQLVEIESNVRRNVA
jgi:subfamily B ATP-binding cassette protein MsbA